MSKLGRNRKGRGHGAKPTGWKPAVATHVVRYGIVKDKYGRDDYKPMIMPKK